MDINGSNIYKSYIDKSNIMNSYIYNFNVIIDDNIIGLRCYAEKEEDILKAIIGQEQKCKINNEEEWLDYLRLREVSPYIFRSSFFVTCYSFIEYTLIDICDFLQREYKYNKNLNDFGKRKNIFIAKDYLKKAANIEFPDTNDCFPDNNKDCWEKITTFNIIRNYIVHNGGILEKEDNNDKVKKKLNKIESFIEKYPSQISIDNLNRINLSQKFIFHVVDTIDSFFKVFFNIWGMWYNKIHGNN